MRFIFQILVLGSLYNFGCEDVRAMQHRDSSHRQDKKGPAEAGPGMSAYSAAEYWQMKAITSDSFEIRSQ